MLESCLGKVGSHPSAAQSRGKAAGVLSQPIAGAPEEDMSRFAGRLWATLCPKETFHETTSNNPIGPIDGVDRRHAGLAPRGKFQRYGQQRDERD
jgi:hypothetical protein